MQAVVSSPVAYSENLTFEEFLTTPMGQPYADLSKATLIEVIEKYEEHQRIDSPSYTNHFLVTNLRAFEKKYNYTIMPLRVDEVFYKLMYKEWHNREKDPLGINTIKFYFSALSAALSWGSNNRCPVSPTYNKFNIDSLPTLKCALTAAEVAQIYFFKVEDIRVPKKKKTVERKPVIIYKPVTKIIKVPVTSYYFEPIECKRTILKKNKVVVGGVEEVVTEKVLISYTRMQKRKSVKFVDEEVTINKPYKRWVTEEKWSVEMTPLRKDKVKTLNRVKDMMVLLCCMMQRYSDAKRITKENFSSDKTVCYITQQKTGNKATITIAEDAILPKVCREILERYDYCAPYNRGINRFNVLLHELIGHIGGNFATEQIVSEDKIDGEVVRRACVKAKKITSHCGRRTGITNQMENGIPVYQIMKKSGHSNMDSLQAYDLSRSKADR